MNASAMRIRGFLRKEALQTARDPSSIALALLMPVVLILLFGYGVSLDARDVPLAVVLEDGGPVGRELFARLQGSDYFELEQATSFAAAEERLRAHAVEGIVRVPANVERGLAGGGAEVQLVLRGVDSNRARLIDGYFQGVVGKWIAARAARGEPAPAPVAVANAHVWCNAAGRSTDFLVPGLVALVMTLTGVLPSKVAVKKAVAVTKAVKGVKQVDDSGLKSQG